MPDPTKYVGLALGPLLFVLVWAWPMEGLSPDARGARPRPAVRVRAAPPSVGGPEPGAHPGDSRGDHLRDLALGQQHGDDGDDAPRRPRHPGRPRPRGRSRADAGPDRPAADADLVVVPRRRHPGGVAP